MLQRHHGGAKCYSKPSSPSSKSLLVMVEKAATLSSQFSMQPQDSVSPVVTLLRWPPLTPLMTSLPIKVSEHT